MPRTRRTLARRYRRLLLCYPRRYRRARGEEIVATFLDLAPPDRTRPTLREAVNLVRHGLRCRLGRPNSRRIVLWATLTAIVWGLFTGAFATRLAWETARPLPTQAEAAQLFGRILGRDRPVQVYLDPALFVIYGQPLGRQNMRTLLSLDGGEYQQGRAMASLSGTPDIDHEDLVDATRARLRADGWQVSDVLTRNSVECLSCDRSTLPTKAVFAARRGDDVLNLEIQLGARPPPPPKAGVTELLEDTYARVELTRASPVAVYPAGIAGFLLGGAFGWLVFGWASRRTDGGAPLTRTATSVLFVVALPAWCLPMVLAVPATLAHQRNEPHPSWHPMWEWLGQPALTPLFVIGTGAALLALAVSALPRRAEPAANAQSSR